MQDDAAAHLADAENESLQGRPDAQRKIGACTYIARVLQQISDKVTSLCSCFYVNNKQVNIFNTQ